mgnify:CR=1 FL=1
MECCILPGFCASIGRGGVCEHRVPPTAWWYRGARDAHTETSRWRQVLASQVYGGWQIHRGKDITEILCK